MRIGLVEIDRLKQRRENPRRMSETEFETLKKSVARFGFSTFIVVVEEEPGVFGVVDGHHRWKLAKETGMQRVPVVVIKDDKNYTDLAMLTFNVSGDPIESVFVDMLAELTKKLGAEEVGGFTALDPTFLEELSKTAEQAFAAMNTEQSTAPEDSSSQDMPDGQSWQGKVLVIQMPDTPENQALIKKVCELTKQEVVGIAVHTALAQWIDTQTEKAG